jgi:hypothetical protein
MSRRVKPIVDRALDAVEVALDEPTAAHVEAARATADLAFDVVETTALSRGEAKQILLLASQLRAMLTVIDRRTSALQLASRLN